MNREPNEDPEYKRMMALFTSCKGSEEDTLKCMGSVLLTAGGGHGDDGMYSNVYPRFTGI